MVVLQYQCKKCYSVFEQSNEINSPLCCLYCGSSEVRHADKSGFIKERDCFSCKLKDSCDDYKSGCSMCKNKHENYIY